PAAAARNRSPREVRDPARQALRPGCEGLAVRLLCNAGDGSAAPAPKTATVERREASVPRHGKFQLHVAPRYSIGCVQRMALSIFNAIALYCAPWCPTPIFWTLAGHRSLHFLPKPRNAKLESATARRKLAVRKKPYWTTISPGIHLGYRRNAG